MKKNKLPEGYTYIPMPSFLRTGPSDIDGDGLFTTRDLLVGEVLGTSHYDLHCSEVVYNEEKAKKLEIEFPMLMMRSRMGSYINHSEDNPSVIMITDDNCHYEYMMVRTVSAGEELTIDYSKTPCYGRGNCTAD